MKKLLSFLIAALMLVSLPAVAEEVMITKANEQYDKVTFMGVFEGLEEGKLVVKEEIVREISVDEKTYIIDENANALSLNDIKKGDKLLIVASAAETRSLPPISYGYVITVITDSEVTKPTYAEVAQVNSDKYFSFDTVDGEFVVYIDENTNIRPFITKNIIRKEDIVPGTKLLFYTDIMTLSIPAKCTAKEIVVLELPVQESVNDDLDVDSLLSGVNNLPKQPYFENDSYMVPLRALSEKLGFNVSWNESDGLITISNNKNSAYLYEGSNKVKVTGLARNNNSDREINLKENVIIIDGFTYVPKEFFTEFMG